MIEKKVVSLLADGNKTIGKVVLKDGLYHAQKTSSVMITMLVLWIYVQAVSVLMKTLLA